MNKIIHSLAIAVVLSAASGAKAAVTISHTESAVFGQFFNSGGAALSSGAVSIGFFTSAPADAAFGVTINSWADLIGAGYTDVRSLPSASLAVGFDWDLPLPVGGSVQNIPVASLAPNTQLYVVAFDAGTFNVGAPLNSFTGATQWAVTKDTAGLSPVDLGTKSMLLSNVSGAEVLRGTDNGINVNMTSLGAGPVPEPSRLMLLGLGGLGLFFRRRRC